MPAIVTLTDETTWLIKCTPYDELHCHISHLEQELKDTSYDLHHALCKVDDLCHLSAPSMVEQATWGSAYDPSQEAGSSQVDPPPMPAVPPSSSLRGRIQANPAPQVELVGKGKVKVPPVNNQAAPDLGLEEEITSTAIYDDIPVVIDTAVQGTLFPEFTGYENPYRVLALGQGKDGVRMILFVRVNNNPYAYSNERLGMTLANICQGTPPPVPTRQHFASSATKWDRGIMGPIALINTMEDTCNLYAQTYDEPEEQAPCICRVKDLLTYINLWKKCKLETDERWIKGPSSPSVTKCQKILGLLEPPLFIKGPPPGVNCSIPEEGVIPLVEKQEGGIPELPQEAPPLNAPFQNWVKFIQMYQNRYSGSDESSELSRMLPGALGIRSFSQMATMADVTAYLAANGITPHDANNATIWAHRAVMGGDQDPNVQAVVNLLTLQALHDISWENILKIFRKEILSFGQCY
ncbi:hypothetical protein EDD17DRAFT_1821633 [Pisolithus thermaeus]|nr:hypothetical protein EDD17DRAFT_1821633 [Pisolithus thermaeus]